MDNKIIVLIKILIVYFFSEIENFNNNISKYHIKVLKNICQKSKPQKNKLYSYLNEVNLYNLFMFENTTYDRSFPEAGI